MACPEKLVICLMFVTTISAINRPVYKIVLTQKGFTQFLQYDVETPPLREFTFCTWIRIYDLAGDQSIFTYVANGDKRVVRLWLDSGGRYMKVSMNGRVAASAPVEFVKDVWRHVCLSYQSDYGAWALYVDSKLVSCEVTQSLYGFVLPRGGSLIIGYGTAENGIPSGLEGEVFGANMILTSTIERNHTTKLNHLYDQKSFHQNKIKSDDNTIQYVVLSDLQTDEIHNNFEKTQLPSVNRTRSFIRLKTPYSHIEHNVGLDTKPILPKGLDMSNEKEILDFALTDTIKTTSEKNAMNFWNIVNQAGHKGKFRTHKETKPISENSASSTRDLEMISEYETPPPPPPHFGQVNNVYFNKNVKEEKSPMPKSIFNVNHDLDAFSPSVLSNTKKVTDILPDVETPPPPVKDTKVYGQWTSSKFAGSVLNYLKSINYHSKEKKVPSTIPLPKNSDNYPYASEFKITKLRPPIQFQRRNFMDRKMRIKKRDITEKPQINVQIIEDDFRNVVIKQHAQTQPKDVEITIRGNPTKDRFYRNAENQVSKENFESEEILKPKPFKIKSAKQSNKVLTDYDMYKNNNLMTILPFLKSLEYFVADSQKIGSETVLRSKKKEFDKKISKMYSKSLSNANKWHNVKSYSNDFTPRHLNLDSEEIIKGDIDAKVAEANKKHPSIRLKYQHDSHKLVENNEDPAILKGRRLAMSVSNQSNANADSISLVKYNHGFLPSHDDKIKNSEKSGLSADQNLKQRRVNARNNFNKNVKLGNALNERHVIGFNEEQKKQSFIGGDESIPDINRYRSELDNENIRVPSSLGPRVCKNIDQNDRVLYVQPDLSIDTSHIMSPVKKQNIAIEFIQQNYNKCSLDGSLFEKSYLLFIDWSKTPVRLFGGAYPKTTTDLCGFFK